MSNIPMRRQSQPSLRASPFREMTRMQREMDRMFNQFLSSGWDLDQPGFTARMEPLCDVEDRDSHYVFSFDVPGFKKDELKIEVVDNQLHVFGEKQEEKEDRQGRQISTERSYGSMERWISLPAGTKEEGLEARVENGVLQVAVPKPEASRSRSVQIGDGKSGFFGKLLGKKDEAKKDGKAA